MQKDSLVVYIKHSISYIVFFHEPDFFAMFMNPLALPVKQLQIAATTKIDKNTLFHTLQVSFKTLYTVTSKSPLLEYFQVVKKERLNRAEAPCEPANDYSFTSCVTESKARSINCTMPWNKEIPGLGHRH